MRCYAMLEPRSAQYKKQLKSSLLLLFVTLMQARTSAALLSSPVVGSARQTRYQYEHKVIKTHNSRVLTTCIGLL